MHRPSLRQLLALLRRGLVGVEDVREAAHLLMRGLDVQAMSLGRGFGFTPLAVTHDIADSWRELHRRWLFLDPSPAFLAQSGRVPYHVAVHSTPAEKVRPLFRGFLAHGFLDATISRYDGFNGTHYMALYRAKSRRSIGDDDTLLLELLQPHLERGLSTALAATAIDGSVDAPIPIAWVDLPSGTTHLAEGAMRALVVELGLEERARRRRFIAMLGDRARRSIDAPPALAVSATRRLEAAVVDAKRSGPRPRGAVAARVFFALCPRPAEANVADDLLGMLTPAQRAVATRAAAGEPLRRVAKGLGMTYGTARVHLREVYRKLDVHGRDELRARLRSPS
jgi:DNA-binding CsgD family transcriptional regulator